MNLSLLPLVLFFAISLLGGAESSTSEQVGTEAPLASPAQLHGLILASGDQLKVEVYDNPDLDSTLRVSGEPSTFPLIGSLDSLLGKTPEQVAKIITARLADGFILHPHVTVEVLTLSKRSAAVLGAVRLPQQVELPPFSNITALQALAAAGGQLEDGTSVGFLLRKGAPDTQLRLGTALGEASDNPTLRDGDVIIVPRLDRVFVLGEVTKPGPITLSVDQKLTVTQAISSSGGFSRAARQSRVQLLRDGERITLDIGSLLDGKGGADVTLKPADVIFVPDSLF
jgi:polysaccharide export outer membrane protein